MSVARCAHYCQDYGRCWRLLWSFKAYEREYGEKHPAQRALDALGDPPPCLRPYPPEHHFRAMGPGGTNS